MAKRKNKVKRNPKGGIKKGDKIHGQKKGKKGEAAAYVTRAQALAKLQIPLADFRKLCILKGIYPRDPKKKAHGNDKTYYHQKDIAFLRHEPLLSKFFELKTFMKKFKRLMGRREIKSARRFEERKPKYTLHHLVRERYPSFDDAIRDLDDAVSMLALFQSLSADQAKDIPVEAITEATQLYQEFQLYVIRAQALRKVFASIKGYYFQADILGHSVTWLAPHQFAQELPAEVDFRVMLTFLEFYRAMVKFVNFRLYSDLGLSYPPRRDVVLERTSADVAALEVEMREAGKAQQLHSQDSTEIETSVLKDFGDQSEVAEALAEAGRMKTTFRGLRVFVNREVPLRPLYFVLLCGGVAEVGWERGAQAGESAGPGSAFPMEGDSITHQVVDRPAGSFEVRPGREYVQPQWVFDCFNIGCLLPIAPYAAGRTPPPHLSPFVDDKAEGYVPRQREILDRFAAEVSGKQDTEKDTGDSVTMATVGTSLQHFGEELQAESSGLWHSEFRRQREEEAAANMARATKTEDSGAVDADDLQPAHRPSEAEEERLRAKALMPKKHKRLLQRIENAEAKRKDASKRLKRKAEAATS
ncbi:PES [Symbiodinium natans]|uniref:Pescadillo homolog n=1 Tax=Symbiodinium natans TaxID=878477 RepID=A0A812RP88_9DINO|nr:PES [Symbiodinium natans]